MSERTRQRLAMLGLSAPLVEQPAAAVDGPPARVSVVVPCYNYGHFLPQCVASVLTQTGVEVDVVIVDDASPDGSAEVARRLADADERVRAICHERNAGHIRTYNDGLSSVEGEYAVLLSADDLLTPGALGRATALMRAHPTVGMTYGHAVAFTGEPPPARTEVTGWTVWRGADWLADRCRTGRNALRSPEAVMRTSVLREVGGYRPELPHAGDFEMWMRAATVSDIGYVGGTDQAYYRIHGQNMHTSTFAAFEAKGIVTDLNQRRACFDAVVTDPGLLSVAYRSLARAALVLAIRAYHWGQADVWPIDDLAAFARELCPPGELRPLWRAFDRRRRVGVDRARFHPLFQPRKQLHKVWAEWDRWRLRQAGV